MAYRTKVEVRTNGKVYAPGSILPTDMSKIDLDFLKKRKFIELVEIDERVAAADEIEEDDCNFCTHFLHNLLLLESYGFISSNAVGFSVGPSCHFFRAAFS